MRFDGMNKWLQIISNFGVLAGLLLLAFEINHSSALVESELRTNAMSDWANSDLARFSESINENLAKSLEHPQDLTLGEMIELDAYFTSYLNMIERSNVAYKLGFSEYSTEQAVRDVINIFGSEYAQAWWRERRVILNPEIGVFIDQHIQSVTADQELMVYRRIASMLSE